MSDNINDAFNSLKKMVDSGNIPSEVQGIINNLNNNSNDSNNSLNSILSQVSPEMLNNLSSMLQSNNSNTNNSNHSANNPKDNFNLDPKTLMKMTSMINAMNKKDNPGSNLLYSLKPYLRESRKDKLDQYANLLNITKIADLMKNENKENNNA